MDIRTWQDAGRVADDPYHPRHRSGRSPFRPWRPGPVAVGSLSTAAVAAVAFAAPGVMHVRSTPVDTRLDGAPHHIGPLTPGPSGTAVDGTPSATSSQGDTPTTAVTTAPPSSQSGTTQGTTSGGYVGTAGGTIRSAGTHAPGGSQGTVQTGGQHQPGGPAGTTTQPPSGGGTTPGGTGSAPTTGGKTGSNGGSTGGTKTAPTNGGSTSTGGTSTGGSSTGGSGPGGTTTGGAAGGPGGTTTAPATAFDAAAAVNAALITIDQARAADHLGRLRVDKALTRAAAIHTDDMATNGTFSHLGTDGSDPYTRAMWAGCFTFTKEIIARGNPGDDVIKSLLQDPGAYRALTSAGSRAIGIAAQQDPDTGQILWTIELGWA